MVAGAVLISAVVSLTLTLSAERRSLPVLYTNMAGSIHKTEPFFQWMEEADFNSLKNSLRVR